MKKSFISDLSTKVYFGDYLNEALADELHKYGRKLLLVYGGSSIKKTGLYDRLMDILEGEFEITEYPGIHPNPPSYQVNEASEICRSKGIEAVLAVGGGSVIDASKLICASTFYDGDCWDLVSRKAPFTRALPLVVVLTNAATGSETNINSVITNLAIHKKKGVKNDIMRPKASFLDPELTYSVGPYVTACGVSDILSHVLETFISPTEGLYMLDEMMISIMKTTVHYGRTVLEEPENWEARANIMLASGWAINGFVRSMTPHVWCCHQLQHECAAYYMHPHGQGLAIIVPAWLRYILSEKTQDRICQFGEGVFGIEEMEDRHEEALRSIEAYEHFLFDELKLHRRLRDIGVKDDHLEDMARGICGDGVLAGIKDLTAEDIVKIYEMSY